MGLNKHLIEKAYAYFTNRLHLYEYKRNWLKGDCPDCGREAKFGVNLALNKTNCFVCGYNDKPLKLIQVRERLDSYADVLEFLGGLESNYSPNYEEAPLSEIPVILPEGFTAIKFGDNKLGRLARQYMENRGFSLEDLSIMGVGYCTVGKYLGQIILPFYYGTELKYFHARRFINNGPKFNNPTLEEVGIGKSHVIYNINSLYIYKKVFLVESVINALTLGSEAIASGGKKVSTYQLNIIIKSPIEKIILILDPDAMLESIKLGLKLVDYKKVKIVTMPIGKDVNDIGKDETLAIVRKTPYVTYQELMKLKHLYDEQGTEPTY